MKIFDAARIHQLGDSALTLVFGACIDTGLNERVMRAEAAVRAARIAGVVETVPTFASLTVYFDPGQTGHDALVRALREIDLAGGKAGASGRVREIPVVYDGPDLEAVAAETGLTAEGVRDLHVSGEYRVYMLGFLPGFAYLGDLPEQLSLPRLREPRTRVPRGAVAIADRLTSIYPFESPGGWRLIGRTPLVLFDHRAQSPNLLAPGDAVRFRPVSPAEFDKLSRERGA